MGPILRLLIIVIVAWVAFRLVKQVLQARRPTARDLTPDSSRMLACSVCGVHVPETRAIMHAGKTYCSKEHLPTRS